MNSELHSSLSPSLPPSFSPSFFLNEKTDLSVLRQWGGGKAYHLALLQQLDLVVPPWFCLSSYCFDEFLRWNQLDLQQDLVNIRQADKLNFKRDEDQSIKSVDRKILLLLSQNIEKLILENNFPPHLKEALQKELVLFKETSLAVRSSGLDEDSSQNSFAGQFSSFLFQEGEEAILSSIKKCWASAFSERNLNYRIERGFGLNLKEIKVAVVLQKMISAESSGVVFSKNPINPLDRESLFINSLWGLGEGLVSGDLDSDQFEIKLKTKQEQEEEAKQKKTGQPYHRGHMSFSPVKSYKCEKSQKTFAYYQKKNEILTSNCGLEKYVLPPDLQLTSSLNEKQIYEISEKALFIEEKLGKPQDCEWAYDKNKQLYFIQTRPITNIPPSSYFKKELNGFTPRLWDNSNIIESYCGVTSPLTFSFASLAYRQVYFQFCKIMGVPQNLIDENEDMFRNMLGLLRGRIYYNLINWYRLVLLLPGTSNNKSFMETMMGVKQKLDPELEKLFDFTENLPHFSFFQKLSLLFKTLFRFLTIDKIIYNFQINFGSFYEPARKISFNKLSFDELIQQYELLEKGLLKRWQAPIINDYLCMLFFGLLKKLSEKWLTGDDPASKNAPNSATDRTTNGTIDLSLQTSTKEFSLASLQNDLLCGEGNLESTEPTKYLMRIAEKIDKNSTIPRVASAAAAAAPAESLATPTARAEDLSNKELPFREWFLKEKSETIWLELKKTPAHPMTIEFQNFLNLYGFRCINELKLEEPDLHDDPSFIIQSVQSYIKRKSYSIASMEARELEIRAKAEGLVKKNLSGYKKLFYFWILKQTRKSLRNRENLRFARTKIFGVARHLFRAMGEKLKQLELLDNSPDIFYLSLDEILAFHEGRGLTLKLSSLVEQRKKEFEEFRKTPSPPERLQTKGPLGLSLPFLNILLQWDLLNDITASSSTHSPRDSSTATSLPSENSSSEKNCKKNILYGTACCPGIVEGLVRVVHSFKEAENLQGEILVTERTDPGWVPLYPSCSGLLIERGSLLSHSAVVARELGLPTIVGISGGLMKKLKTGQRVRMDASKGEILLLD